MKSENGPTPLMTGIELIAYERNRQIAEGGYTDAHDDEHHVNELLHAAMAYLQAAIYIGDGENVMSAMPKAPDYWPWMSCEFRPSHGPNHNLRKAGALIAAAMDHHIRHNAGSDAPGAVEKPWHRNWRASPGRIHSLVMLFENLRKHQTI